MNPRTRQILAARRRRKARAPLWQPPTHRAILHPGAAPLSPMVEQALRQELAPSVPSPVAQQLFACQKWHLKRALEYKADADRLARIVPKYKSVGMVTSAKVTLREMRVALRNAAIHYRFIAALTKAVAPSP